MKARLALVCIMGVVLAGGLFGSVYAQVTQEWVTRYNGPGSGWDAAKSLAVDGNGNVYITGESAGSGSGIDYATIKYNMAGFQQWVARYNGPANGNDDATSLAVDDNGNVYVTGVSFYGGGTTADYATIKYNAAGAQQWVERYNGPANGMDRANSLAVDGDGNVYVTGESAGSGTAADYATIKYNATGVQQWVARYNGLANLNDKATSLAVDDNGNVYVTGMSYGSGTSYDYLTIKYNAAGVEQWVAIYNGPANGGDNAYSLVLDGDGNVYVTGMSEGSGTGSDYTTIKYNATGQQQWVARYSGPGNSSDWTTSLAVDGNGNVYVTGESYGGSVTNWDYATIKYNASGVQLWTARYNELGNGHDGATSLAMDGDGNVYVTGYSYLNGTGRDYATIKYNSAGVQQWVERYNGPGDSTDCPNSLAVDGNDNVYVTGQSWGSGTNNDYATIKYSQDDAVDPWAVEFPLEFALKSACPNPFNASTVISYELRAASQVKVTVWDTAGRLVATLVEGWTQAGTHCATFDGADLASGIYLAKLQAGEFTATQKLVLLK